MDERKESEFYKFCCGIWNTVDRRIIYLVHLKNFHEVVFLLSIFSVVWNTNLQIFYVYVWVDVFSLGRWCIWRLIPQWSSNIQFTFAKRKCEPFHNVHNRHLQNNLHFKNYTGVNSQRIYFGELQYFILW